MNQAYNSEIKFSESLSPIQIQVQIQTQIPTHTFKDSQPWSQLDYLSILWNNIEYTWAGSDLMSWCYTGSEAAEGRDGTGRKPILSY